MNKSSCLLTYVDTSCSTVGDVPMWTFPLICWSSWQAMSHIRSGDFMGLPTKMSQLPGKLLCGFITSMWLEPWEKTCWILTVGSQIDQTNCSPQIISPMRLAPSFQICQTYLGQISIWNSQYHWNHHDHCMVGSSSSLSSWLLAEGPSNVFMFNCSCDDPQWQAYFLRGFKSPDARLFWNPVKPGQTYN